jgi:cell division septation protein DedD
VNFRRILLAGSLLAAACERSGREPLAALPLVLHSPGPTTLLRLPAHGGEAVAYRSTDLSPLGWSVAKVPAVRRYVGVDLDQGLVYAIDSSRSLMAIDLRARRSRTLRKGIRSATLGPDGTLFAVDTTGRVTEVRGRRPLTLADALPASATELVGTSAGWLLVLPTPRRADLTVFEPEGPAATIQVPAGAATATMAGDLVAVAADSAVVLADPSGAKPPDAIDVSGHARAVMFSPSGHRLYVGRDKDEVIVLDRYSARERDGIDVPGGARDLRGDLYGLWMLVRASRGDTLSVVDLTARSVVARTATTWDDRLPLIAPPFLLLVRRGQDVVGLDLERDGLKVRGQVSKAADDIWVPLAWAPASKDEAVMAAVTDSTALPADSAAPAAGQRFFLQVSSSRNPAWARELAEKIAAAGVKASVVDPANADDVYRVVVGPFASREQADSASRSLGMPSFVIAGPGAPAP